MPKVATWFMFYETMPHKRASDREKVQFVLYMWRDIVCLIPLEIYTVNYLTEVTAFSNIYKYILYGFESAAKRSSAFR